MYNLDQIKIEYNRIGLRWNTESIRYLINKGFEGLTKTFNTLRICDPINTICLVEAAVKDSKQANEIVDNWVNKGYGIATLHILMVEALKEQGFFRTMGEMEMIIDLMKKNKETEEIAMKVISEEIAVQRIEAELLRSF